MDEYGVFRDVESDYQALWAALRLYGAVTFSFSTFEDLCFTITIVPKSKQLGVRLFLGDSVLAVHGKGAFPFNLERRDHTSVGYVSEKLGLNASDAVIIATLINGIRNASQAMGDTKPETL